MQSAEIRDALMERLRQDMVGPMDAREVLDVAPSRHYLCGFLIPSDTPLERAQDDHADEALEGGTDSDQPDDSGGEAPSRFNLFPSSLGLSVLVPAGVSHLDVELRWGEYGRLDAEQSRHWENRSAEALGQTPPEREDGEGPAWAYWRRISEPLVRQRVVLGTSGELSIPEHPGLKLALVLEPAHGPGLPPGTRSVALFLVNRRSVVDGPADEQYLFQASMALHCDQGFVPRPQRSEGGDADIRRADLQFRDKLEWAVGHGVSSRPVQSADEASEGRCRRVESAWMPDAHVFRMESRGGGGLVLDMDHWGACTDPSQVVAGTRSLVAEYEEWIAAQRAQLATLETQQRRDTASELLSAAQASAARMLDGAQALVEDPQLFTAFTMANRAMARAARAARPDQEEAPAWRAFQLAFLLMNLRGVQDGEHPDRQVVDLLFFPTGGGKTEAYLGVAAVTMFLRRLRGQALAHGGLGVSVLLRYTLRLLTLDQLGRAAALVCAMNLERVERLEQLGEEPFRVGLWVGRKATPLRMKEAREQLRLYRERKKPSPEDAPLPLEACPWCGTSFTKDSFEIPPGQERLVVRCASLDCAFSGLGELGELPLVVVDEQIYRELPEFLLATVDKFASLPWRGATGMLFGRVQGQDKHGFVGHHQVAMKGLRTLPDLPPPDLVIQDELHLISGPLGTMVGLYETALEGLMRGQGGGPKILASTATARRSREQIQALFARSDSRLFPPPGLTESDSFFAREDRAGPGRAYLGISAPGRSMKAVVARVYASLLSAGMSLHNQAGEGLKRGALNPADPYMTLVAYFNSLKELGGAQRLVAEEVAPRLRNMSRRRSLDQGPSQVLADRLLAYEVLELTSRQTTGDIRQAKAKLEARWSTKNRNDVLLASSMISVGVDIPRLGLMVVNGQPKTVAEYIQASSRVGRRFPGLVVTLLNAYRPRDRSHYERFQAFHESFYRYVEAASVTPFSPRALDRGLAGLILGLARHGHPGMAPARGAQKVGQDKGLEQRLVALLLARMEAHRGELDPTRAQELEQRVHRLMQSWGDCTRLFADAGLVWSPWEHGDAKTRGSVALLRSFEKSAMHRELDPFAAPTSMRDVEPPVHLWVDSADPFEIEETEALGAPYQEEEGP